MVPLQVWRTMVNPDTVAQGAGVSMMQAPCSLVALTWGVMKRGARGNGILLSADADVAMTHTLFASSTVIFWLTVVATVRRRSVIASRGFGVDWVAFTFPSCSTAVAGECAHYILSSIRPSIIAFIHSFIHSIQFNSIQFKSYQIKSTHGFSPE